MKRSGVSISWISEHIVKEPNDYGPVGYIFEHMKVAPAYESFKKWSAPFGDDGLPSAYALVGGAPMHHILKVLMDPTQFYYQHHDHEPQMENLADHIGVYYRRWRDRITIFGGIPSNLLLAEATGTDAFEGYMKTLFSAVAPGSRFMLAIADTTPPGADFDRLRRIHDLVRAHGKLPLKA